MWERPKLGTLPPVGFVAANCEWRAVGYSKTGRTGIAANIGDGRIISLSNSLRFRVHPELTFDLASTFNDGRVTEPSAKFLVLIGQTGIPMGPTAAGTPDRGTLAASRT